MLNQKKNGATTLSPLTEQSPSNVPSVSEGGSSGLENGASEPQKYTIKKGSNFNPFSEAPAKVGLDDRTTAIGNTLPIQSAPISAVSNQNTLPVSAPIVNQSKMDYDKQTKNKIAIYDQYKRNLPEGQKASPVDFYLETLKRTDPDEYQFIIDKQKDLSETKNAINESGDPFKSLTGKNQQSKIEKFHAELLKKAIAERDRVAGGKLEMTSNAVNRDYKDIIKEHKTLSDTENSLSEKIKGIDDFINSEYEKDENGQLITNQYNKKPLQDLLAKRESFIGEFNANKEKKDAISKNEDLQTALSMLDDVENEYNDIHATYKGLMEENPEFYKGLPSYKKNLEDSQRAQFSKDLNEAMTGGDLGLSEGVGQAVTGIVKQSGYILKDLGIDKKYGWSDAAYDGIKNITDEIDTKINPLPTGYNKPFYDNKTGEFNLRYAPGKLAGTITAMAPAILASGGAGALARLAASESLGQAAGSFAANYVMTVEDNYNAAKEANMSETDAQDFASQVGLINGIISTISPDIKLISNKSALADYTKFLAEGISKKDAIARTVKKIGENAMKEVPEELMQTYNEIMSQNDMYEKIGLNDKVRKSIKNEMYEVVMTTAAVSAILGLGTHKSTSQLSKESLLAAIEMPEQVMKQAENLLKMGKLKQEDFDKFSVAFPKYVQSMQKIDPNLPTEKKAEIIVPLTEKEELKAEKQTLDDTQHDNINEKIKLKDEEIKNVMESPSKEQLQDEEYEKEFMSLLEEELNADKKEEAVNQPTTESQEAVSTEEQPQQTEQEIKESSVQELEKQKQEIAQEAEQGKIDTVEQGKKENEIDKEINSIEKPITVEETTEELPKTESVVEETTTPPVTENVTDNSAGETKTSPATIEPTTEAKKADIERRRIETEAKPITPITKTKEQISAEQSIEEETDNNEVSDVNEDVDTRAKMEKDFAGLQFISKENYPTKTPKELKELIEKKYIGTLAKAYKAKVEGKISKQAYTEYRNRLNKMMEEKLKPFSSKKSSGDEGESLRRGEVKAQISALGELAKQKLLGEGFTNVAMSSMVPFGPRQVSKLIDMTVKGINHLVDAKYELQDAVTKALKATKKSSLYNSLVEQGLIDEADFEKTIKQQFSKVDDINTEPIVEKTVEEKTEGATESNKETTENAAKEEKEPSEKEPQSNKESEQNESKPDIGTGRKKVMKHFDRMTKNPEYKELVAAIDKKGMFQDETNIKKTEQYVDSVVKEYNDQDLLPDLAIELLNNDKMFPAVLQTVISAKVAQKLFSMSANEDLNSFERSELVNLAGKLMTPANLSLSEGGKMLSVAGRIVKSIFEDVSASEPQTKALSTQKVKEVQDQMLTKKEKTALENSDKDINDALQSEEFKQEVEKAADEKIKNMRDKLMGEEKSTKFANFIKSLKINLKDC